MFRSVGRIPIFDQALRLFTRRTAPLPRSLERFHPDPFGADFQRKLELLANLARRTQVQLFRPTRSDKRRGSGVEFAEYRDYVPGDDFRFVDPYAAMRLDKLYLRQFEEQEDQSIYLLLDSSLSMGHNARRKLDCAKRLAAAIAFIGLSRLDHVAVTALGEEQILEHRITRGRGHFPSILRFLRSIEPNGSTNLEAALRRFAARHRGRGVAILLSDLFDPAGCERGLDVLRYERFGTTVLHLQDARDLELGVLGDHTLIDCETGQACNVTITRAVVAELHRSQRHFADEIERHCRSRGMDYLAVDAGSDFEPTIRRLLIGERQPRS